MYIYMADDRILKRFFADKYSCAMQWPKEDVFISGSDSL